MDEGTSFDEVLVNGDRSYRFAGSSPGNAVPNQVTLFATPWSEEERMRPDLGIFAQDRWTMNRLTLNLGLRFEYLRSYVPALQLPAGSWVPARDFPAVEDVPNWRDLYPRIGGSYDVFGNGRTALRASIGKYGSATTVDIAEVANPGTPAATTNRTWNDSLYPVGDPRRGNYVPDCDLANRAANGECGADSNQAFGLPLVTTHYADDVVHGFGRRQYLWDFSTEVQQQLGSGLSITGGYYRNWAGNFTATQNLATTPADFSPYCVTAPLDSRLPGGGGYQVCGLYDVAPARFGQVNTLISPASKFGTQTFVNDFFTFNLTSRFGGGAQLGGGLDTGRSVSDKCFVVDSPAQTTYDISVAATPTYCHVVTPFKAQTQVKLYGSYPLPLDFQVSGVIQNLSGPVILASYTAGNALVAPSLGRNLAAGPSGTVTIPLIAPQTMWADRRTQLDVRLTKLFKVGPKIRLNAYVDLYNVTNNSSTISVISTYGPVWTQPSAVLDGRLLQFGSRLSF